MMPGQGDRVSSRDQGLFGELLGSQQSSARYPAALGFVALPSCPARLLHSLPPWGLPGSAVDRGLARDSPSQGSRASA
jgi:hypothetical protein